MEQWLILNLLLIIATDACYSTRHSHWHYVTTVTTATLIHNTMVVIDSIIMGMEPSFLQY
jgi:hypothetical protein